MHFGCFAIVVHNNVNTSCLGSRLGTQHLAVPSIAGSIPGRFLPCLLEESVGISLTTEYTEHTKIDKTRTDLGT